MSPFGAANGDPETPFAGPSLRSRWPTLFRERSRGGEDIANSLGIGEPEGSTEHGLPLIFADSIIFVSTSTVSAAWS